MEGPFNLVASVGIFLLMEDIFRVGGLGVVDRDFSGLEGGAGVGSLDGARETTLEAVWDLVTARDLPRLGVRGGGFGVFGKSPGNGLLLDPPLIYFIG